MLTFESPSGVYGININGASIGKGGTAEAFRVEAKNPQTERLWPDVYKRTKGVIPDGGQLLSALAGWAHSRSILALDEGSEDADPNRFAYIAQAIESHSPFVLEWEILEEWFKDGAIPQIAKIATTEPAARLLHELMIGKVMSLSHLDHEIFPKYDDRLWFEWHTLTNKAGEIQSGYRLGLLMEHFPVGAVSLYDVIDETDLPNAFFIHREGVMAGLLESFAHTASQLDTLNGKSVTQTLAPVDSLGFENLPDGIRAKAHFHTWHRDLKPGNTYLVVDPSGRARIMIVDWGMGDIDGFSEGIRLVGTDGYIASERRELTEGCYNHEGVHTEVAEFARVCLELVLGKALEPSKKRKAGDILDLTSSEGSELLRKAIARLKLTDADGLKSVWLVHQLVQATSNDFQKRKAYLDRIMPEGVSHLGLYEYLADKLRLDIPITDEVEIMQILRALNNPHNALSNQVDRTTEPSGDISQVIPRPRGVALSDSHLGQNTKVSNQEP